MTRGEDSLAGITREVTRLAGQRHRLTVDLVGLRWEQRAEVKRRAEPAFVERHPEQSEGALGASSVA
jgi:hypothetical protein